MKATAWIFMGLFSLLFASCTTVSNVRAMKDDIGPFYQSPEKNDMVQNGMVLFCGNYAFGPVKGNVLISEEQAFDNLKRQYAEAVSSGNDIQVGEDGKLNGLLNYEYVEDSYFKFVYYSSLFRYGKDLDFKISFLYPDGTPVPTERFQYARKANRIRSYTTPGGHPATTTSMTSWYEYAWIIKTDTPLRPETLGKDKFPIRVKITFPNAENREYEISR